MVVSEPARDALLSGMSRLTAKPSHDRLPLVFREEPESLRGTDTVDHFEHGLVDGREEHLGRVDPVVGRSRWEKERADDPEDHDEQDEQRVKAEHYEEWYHSFSYDLVPESLERIETHDVVEDTETDNGANDDQHDRYEQVRPRNTEP